MASLRVGEVAHDPPSLSLLKIKKKFQALVVLLLSHLTWVDRRRRRRRRIKVVLSLSLSPAAAAATSSRQHRATDQTPAGFFFVSSFSSFTFKNCVCVCCPPPAGSPFFFYSSLMVQWRRVQKRATTNLIGFYLRAPEEKKKVEEGSRGRIDALRNTHTHT